MRIGNIRTYQGCLPKVNTPDLCPRKIGASEVGTVKLSVQQLSTHKIGAGESGFVRYNTVKFGTREVSFTEIGSNKLCLSKVNEA